MALTEEKVMGTHEEEEERVSEENIFLSLPQVSNNSNLVFRCNSLPLFQTLSTV